MRAIATCLMVLVATGDAVAGRSFYGWLPATDIVRDGGTEVETWIAEEDDEGPTHLRETVLGAAPVFAAGDRFELAIPFELVRATEDGADPIFALRSFALEARVRFAGREAMVAPFLRVRAERDVIVRNLARVRIGPAVAVSRGPVHVVASANLVAEASRGGLHLEVHPGLGASFCVRRGLRVGAELFGELSLDEGGRSWLTIGPNLAWIRRHSWLAASLGIGIHDIQAAPRIVWGLAL